MVNKLGFCAHNAQCFQPSNGVRFLLIVYNECVTKKYKLFDVFPSHPFLLQCKHFQSNQFMFCPINSTCTAAAFFCFLSKFSLFSKLSLLLSHHFSSLLFDLFSSLFHIMYNTLLIALADTFCLL